MKANFRSKYPNNILCPLCRKETDDQQHILECSVLKRKFEIRETVANKCEYEDIFVDYKKQKQITHLFSKLIKIRNKLVDENLCLVLAPSTSAEVLEDNDNLPIIIL